MPRKGVLGVLTISGFPGHYTLRPGLTGTPIVSSVDKPQLLEALAEILVSAEEDKANDEGR